MTDYPGPNATFGELVKWHRLHGTRPDGLEERWLQKKLGEACGSGDRTVRSWEQNEHFPPSILQLCRALFGKNTRYTCWQTDLQNAHARAKGTPKTQTPPDVSQIGLDRSSAQEPLKLPTNAASASQQSPEVDEIRFTITPPPNHGANWRPCPSYLDEKKGYQFGGYFEVEAAIDCDIACISLEVMRNGHLPICIGPGKSSYYNGPLPGEKRKYGYVLIDGEEEFVDANWRFLRLVRLKAGQKYIIAISRWCRAIGMSRNEPLTLSIEYWLEQLTQVVTIEYVYAGERRREGHVFEFADTGIMLTGRHSQIIK